jgi:hypothetical protein
MISFIYHPFSCLIYSFNKTNSDGKTENAGLVIAAILRMVMMNCGSCRLEKIVAVFVAPALKSVQ